MDPKWTVVEHLPDLFMGEYFDDLSSREEIEMEQFFILIFFFFFFFRKGIRRSRTAGGKSVTVDQRLEK